MALCNNHDILDKFFLEFVFVVCHFLTKSLLLNKTIQFFIEMRQNQLFE